MANEPQELSKDTHCLQPDDLSRDRLVAIQEIESRLRDAQNTPVGSRTARECYLAYAEDRHPRVLLVDGARGTGKTSLLLTMIERWHRPEAGPALTTYQTKQGEFCRSAYLRGLLTWHEAPEHVRVLPILDFDPLPPGVPLVAALVQAWRNIVIQFDKISANERGLDIDQCDDLLSDDWHKLFAMAAAGWSNIPSSRGLIEQVLDREDQVQDWHDFQRHWRAFIDKMVNTSQRIERQSQKTGTLPVFVIMIDDCDLQVERISELLPALRMLYHPRLFFIVAADRPHMIDMLNLDFLGKQHRLAYNCSDSAVDQGAWAGSLASASFEKVFSVRNRWTLSKMSMRELLGFEIRGKSFKTILDSWRDKAQRQGVGTYLQSFAGTRADPILPSLITHRTAHQVLDYVLTARPSASNDAEMMGPVPDAADAIEAVARLLGRDEYGSLVRIVRPEEAIEVTNANETAALPAQTGEDDAASKGAVRVEFLQRGRLEAYSVPEDSVDMTYSAKIQLSAQPDFRYRRVSNTKRDEEVCESFLRTSAILAQSLEDDGFDVFATRQQWDARLGFVWTEIDLYDHDLALAWPWYRHPSPLRLLRWAEDWREFLDGLTQRTGDKPERIAYAWIYYQLFWMDEDSFGKTNKAELVKPSETDLSDSDWNKLLVCEVKSKKDDHDDQWRVRTLALLARPEVGLPSTTQARLLEGLSDPQKKWLVDERRTRITDAILTAADRDGEDPPKDANRAKIVDSIISAAAERQKQITNSVIPWDEEMKDVVAEVSRAKLPG